MFSFKKTWQKIVTVFKNYRSKTLVWFCQPTNVAYTYIRKVANWVKTKNLKKYRKHENLIVSCWLVSSILVKMFLWVLITYVFPVKMITPPELNSTMHFLDTASNIVALLSFLALISNKSRSSRNISSSFLGLFGWFLVLKEQSLTLLYALVSRAVIDSTGLHLPYQYFKNGLINKTFIETSFHKLVHKIPPEIALQNARECLFNVTGLDEATWIKSPVSFKRDFNVKINQVAELQINTQAPADLVNKFVHDTAIELEPDVCEILSYVDTFGQVVNDAAGATGVGWLWLFPQVSAACIALYIFFKSL